MFVHYTRYTLPYLTLQDIVVVIVNLDHTLMSLSKLRKLKNVHWQGLVQAFYGVWGQILLSPNSSNKNNNTLQTTNTNQLTQHDAPWWIWKLATAIWARKQFLWARRSSWVVAGDSLLNNHCAVLVANSLQSSVSCWDRDTHPLSRRDNSFQNLIYNQIWAV